MGEENQEKQENQEGKVTLDKKDRFNWTKLYPKIAEKLEKYGDEQKELIEFLTKENNIGIPEGTANTIEKFGIDPFSFFALFNRNINNRRGVIKVFCGFLNVNIDKSEIDNINFHGIPLVDSRNILFYSKEEKDNDPRETIKALWRVFIKSFEFERDPALDIDKFSDLFNEALSCKQVSNMFATALFWIHPDKFIPFDTNTRTLINNFILTEEEANDNCSQLEGDSESFRDKKDKLKELKDLTWVGYRELCKKVNEKIGKVKNGENEENKEIMKELEIDDNNRYASFSHKARELSFLDELFTNKNIILYGPPGTGKTYQTLQAIKLMTKNNSNYFKSYQFHPNYTYDDFIDGIKPVGFENGQIQLELCNGHFKDFCIKVHKANKKRLYDNDSLISQDEKCEARNGNETENNEDEQKNKRDSLQNYYFIVDEINRGNLSAIFGETFFSIEDSYRFKYFKDGKKIERECLLNENINSLVITQNSMLALRSGKEELIFEKDGDDAKFGIPENIYFIGMMNDVDKSIDAFDLALRRRFSWIEKTYDKEVVKEVLIEFSNIEEYLTNIEDLNKYISSSEIVRKFQGLGLGKQYEFGHSFFLKIRDFTNQKKVTKAAAERLFEAHLKPTLKEYLRTVYSDSVIETNLINAKKIFIGEETEAK